MNRADNAAATATERLDRWLWAARWFKSRSIAVEAINNGRVNVNGERAKPAKMLRVGDVLTIRRPPYTYDITVQGLAAKRVSATLAAALYVETTASSEQRVRLAEQLALGAVREDRRTGKLNKKDRRERELLKRHFE